MTTRIIVVKGPTGWSNFWTYAQDEKKAGRRDDALLFDTWEQCVDFFELLGSSDDDVVIDPRQWPVTYEWSGFGVPPLFVPKDKAMANRIYVRAHTPCVHEDHGHPVPYEGTPVPWL
jgi:hypothetical protein